MLATFNEILFKMPSADLVRFHVEIQLEELFEKVCSLPAYLCVVCGTHLNVKKFPNKKGDFQVSGGTSALTPESVFQFKRRLQRPPPCLCLCFQ